ncbi:MAG TPA: 16S rRNA (uracil(1498)-N(3))-methyltransferase [Caulifigura sp.]|nr:16S rRNA (uracil(1498)-N(3))-methyltransferase [Caulifigura sp.]
MDRFFCPTLSGGTTVKLEDEEFHHLAHVLRVKSGDQVELFDGQGTAAQFVVDRLSKRDAQLSLVGDLRRDEPDRVRLVLGIACPKGDRLKWLVEKATELGVTELVPLLCERSVVEPRETKLAKLEQTVLSACKQCRRNRLMTIGEPQPLAQFLQQPADRVLIAHPGGPPFENTAPRVPAEEGRPVVVRVAIGPEGGFTDSEIAAAEASGVSKISLGRYVLRVETAAVAAAALLSGLV